MTAIETLDVETREGWVAYETAIAMFVTHWTHMSPTIDLPDGRSLWIFENGSVVFYTIEDEEKYHVCDRYGLVLYVFG